jgi:hypothetical protein
LVFFTQPDAWPHARCLCAAVLRFTFVSSLKCGARTGPGQPGALGQFMSAECL